MSYTVETLQEIVHITEVNDQFDLYELTSHLLLKQKPITCFAACRVSGLETDSINFYVEYSSHSDRNFPEQEVKLICSTPHMIADHVHQLFYLDKNGHYLIFLGQQKAYSLTLFVIETEKEISVDKIKLLNPVLCLIGNHLELILHSERDQLTGLFNRQAYQKRIKNVLSNHARRRSLEKAGTDCYCIIDIDHFKKINDNFGHLYGDEVLLQFAQLLMKNIRSHDLAFRFGGEEFIIIMREIERDNVHQTLLRLKETIANHNFPGVGTVTVSMGYTYIMDNDNLHILFERADRAVYYIKNNGRNSLGNYCDLVAENKITALEEEDGGEIELF